MFSSSSTDFYILRIEGHKFWFFVVFMLFYFEWYVACLLFGFFGFGLLAADEIVDESFESDLLRNLSIYILYDLIMRLMNEFFWNGKLRIFRVFNSGSKFTSYVSIISSFIASIYVDDVNVRMLWIVRQKFLLKKRMLKVWWKKGY